MSTRPSSNRLGFRFGCGQAVVIVALLAIWFVTASRKTGPVHVTRAQPASPVRRVVDESSRRNPIEQVLNASPVVPGKAGVAAALLVDTSGSMGNQVRDADGTMRPKIDIARRSVLALLEKTDEFVKAHPDVPVVLAVYEFSDRGRGNEVRPVIPLQPPNLAQAAQAVAAMSPQGGTPIGDAIVRAKIDLDASGYARQHILVVTDGENNRGYAPADVVNVISRQEGDRRASVYFVAFDVAASVFQPVRDAGGLVLAAANGAELQQTLDYVLTGKILAEQPTQASP